MHSSFWDFSDLKVEEGPVRMYPLYLLLCSQTSDLIGFSRSRKGIKRRDFVGNREGSVGCRTLDIIRDAVVGAAKLW